MTKSAIARAKELQAKEAQLDIPELIELWDGRQRAAWAWFCECDEVLRRLRRQIDPRQLDLKVDRVLEPTTPAAPG